MTPKMRECKQCYKPFEPKRYDHYFCCGACVAKFYRENPNPEYIHAENMGRHTFDCEHCGNAFDVNDYAFRGGKRRPKYCSPKCKQAAYRARGKASQEQAKRRYDGSTGHKQQSTGGSQQNAGNGGSSGKTRQPGGSSTYWQGYRSKADAARAILGLGEKYSAKEARTAWMKLLKQFHPDVNPAADATETTQKINWAYEYLKV